jgi:hypothetical protein
MDNPDLAHPLDRHPRDLELAAPGPSPRRRRTYPARLRALLLAVAPILLLAAASCTADGVTETPTPPKARYGEPCATDASCQAPLLCGVNSDGTPACVNACNQTYGASVSAGQPDGTACVNGRETPCNHLPAEITACGCGCGAGAYCLVSQDQNHGTCAPSLAAGSACQGGAMCESGLCCDASGYCASTLYYGQGTCSVPLGTSCAGGAACPACFRANGGTGDPLWCSKSCGVTSDNVGRDTYDCPAGFVCLGASGAQSGFCYESCNSTEGGLTGSVGCPVGSTCKPYVPDPKAEQIQSGSACQ